MEKNEQGAPLSRRDFLRTSAATTAGLLAAGLPTHHFVHAAGTDTLKVGAIGVGGRGRGAINDHLNATTGTVLWAIGDYFPTAAQRGFDTFKTRGDRFQVAPDRVFSGFDNYKQVIDSGVDVVLLTQPPGFRPTAFRYAVEKGKHVFMEKPVAVCPAGVRMVIEASKLAKEKGLAVVAGTQRRHELCYVETVKRIQEKAIGEILAAQCYYNAARPWNRVKQMPAGLTEIEQQTFNWYHYNWLSGDQIVEQHIHNLDTVNWCFSSDADGTLAHPVRAMGVGGLACHRGEDGKSTEPGDIWDSMAVEFEYPGGVRVQSYCRHWDGCPSKRGENIVGTRGTADPAGTIVGANAWTFDGQRGRGQEREHTDLVASIRAGKPLQEGERIAISTMVAVMGRMAAYTGQEVTWDFVMNKSQLNLLVENPQPGPHPIDGLPVPAKTKLV